jgi:cysteinyl-tRNA synthetase
MMKRHVILLIACVMMLGCLTPEQPLDENKTVEEIKEEPVLPVVTPNETTEEPVVTVPEVNDTNVTVEANVTQNDTVIEVNVTENETVAVGLHKIRYWAYQIQDQEWYGNMDKLAASHYDMLVIDDTRTIRDEEDDMTGYDMAGDVRRLHESENSTGGNKIVIAYIDIGEAEDYRWYWQSDWEIGDPEFIEIEDPDGWSGNYPVRYWDEDWKDLMEDYLDIIMDDGFDGIYMDWIEGYENEDIAFAAMKEGKDARDEMIDFICEISEYTKSRKPGFYVIAQNGAELGSSEEYLECIDAVAQEQIWFDGVADAEKGGSEEGDYPMPTSGDYSTPYYISHLKNFQDAGLPVFSVDYAQKQSNVDKAYTEAYKQGYVPYVSIRSLSRLTEDPPPGY